METDLTRPQDPLSEVLSLLKPHSYMAGAIDAGDEWSLEFGEHDGINWNAIVSGSCWLCVDGVLEPVHLQTGDCVFLPRGKTFRLTSDVKFPATDAYTLFAGSPLNGGIRVYNGGGSCLGIGGYFSFNSNHANYLLETLPPIVHIKNDSDKIALRSSMDQLLEELREPQPGGALIAQNLANLLLVKAMRLVIAEDALKSAGWLRALSDQQMSIAIKCMHQEPARQWTLQELAECTNMSRSAFSAKFKEIVGTTPMEYLTKWRMILAADRLTNSSDTISTIAYSLGYESESAFSAAFKRTMGCSPRQYNLSGSVS